MVIRELDKLAEIENHINTVKESGYGEITITVTNGQITDCKHTVGTHWRLKTAEQLAEDLRKQGVNLTVEKVFVTM